MENGPIGRGASVMGATAWRLGAASLALTLTLVVVGWRGCGRSKDQRDEAAVSAACRQGRLGDARGALALWQRRAPNSADAMLWSARLAVIDRRLDEAEEVLRRALSLGASKVKIERLRAVMLALSGRYADAEPVLRDALNAGESDPLLDEALAKIYLETYDLHRAGLVLSRWKLDAPDDPKPHLWRAELDVRANDPAAALADYREALKRDPNSPRARSGLADGLRLAHRNAEAAEAYAASLRLQPDDPAAHLGAGRNAAALGNAAAALRHLTRAAALAPKDPEAQRALADLLTRQGDFRAALDHLDRAVALDPYDLEARHSRGLVLSRLGRLDEAKADQARAAKLRADLGGLMTAQAAVVRSPHDRNAQLTITRWMFAHGKPSEGVRWAESILLAAPGQPDACRLLADHYSLSGQPGLANFYRAQAE